MRFWAFSYSIGEPCERSVQVSMYFMGVLVCLVLSKLDSGLTESWPMTRSAPRTLALEPAATRAPRHSVQRLIRSDRHTHSFFVLLLSQKVSAARYDPSREANADARYQLPRIAVSGPGQDDTGPDHGNGNSTAPLGLGGYVAIYNFSSTIVYSERPSSATGAIRR